MIVMNLSCEVACWYSGIKDMGLRLVLTVQMALAYFAAFHVNVLVDLEQVAIYD